MQTARDGLDAEGVPLGLDAASRDLEGCIRLEVRETTVDASFGDVDREATGLSLVQRGPTSRAFRGSGADRKFRLRPGRTSEYGRCVKSPWRVEHCRFLQVAHVDRSSNRGFASDNG